MVRLSSPWTGGEEGHREKQQFVLRHSAWRDRVKFNTSTRTVQAGPFSPFSTVAADGFRGGIPKFFWDFLVAQKHEKESRKMARLSLGG